MATLNSDCIDSKLAIDTLKIAIEKHKPNKGLILHSDQGVQYTSKQFNSFCQSQHVQQSMSKAGCPYDNAPMERFFNTYKNEHYYHYEYETKETLDESTYDFILTHYNYVRPHTYNGGIPPIQVRRNYAC